MAAGDFVGGSLRDLGQRLDDGSLVVANQSLGQDVLEDGERHLGRGRVHFGIRENRVVFLRNSIVDGLPDVSKLSEGRGHQNLARLVPGGQNALDAEFFIAQHKLFGIAARGLAQERGQSEHVAQQMIRVG